MKPFKKALRKRNQESLEKLYGKAHQHASAAAYLNSAHPGTPTMLSMLLGLQKDIEQLESRIEKLEKKLR